MLDFLHTYATMLWWLGALSIVTFIGSLIVIPVLVARIPADYFTRNTHNPVYHHWHPVLRFLGHLLKNVVGVLFILSGLAMLVLPGQGIITILIGMMLLDFPGKRALEERIVQQPTVLGTINWIRTKARQPALKISESSIHTTEPTPKV